MNEITCSAIIGYHIFFLGLFVSSCLSSLGILGNVFYLATNYLDGKSLAGRTCIYGLDWTGLYGMRYYGTEGSPLLC